jgi:hypothetical protein
MLIFYTAAFVLSIIDLAFVSVQINFTNGLHKPMAEAFKSSSTSPSLVSRLQDYVTYCDSINMQNISEQVENGLSLPQMVSLVNEFYTRTNNLETLYQFTNPFYSTLKSWINSERVKNNIALNKSNVISSYQKSQDDFQIIMNNID